MQYYSTEVMKRLGFMIEFKRNENLKTNKKWKIGEFLRVEEANKICDWKTYQKIKSGKKVSDDLIYDELIEALGYSSSNAVAIIEIVDQLGKELMVPIDYYDVNKIVELCENAKLNLLKYPNGFLINDYLFLIDAIIGNYREGNYVSEDEYSKLQGMYHHSEQKMKSIMIDLMYQYIARHIGELKLINEFVEKYESVIRSNNFLLIYYCEYLMFNQREEESKSESTKLREIYVTQENIVRELMMNMYLFNIFDGLFNRKYYFYYNDIEKIFVSNNDKIPKRVYLGIKYELGMYFYCNEFYGEAFNYFEYCYQHDINRYFRCYIFCAFINKKCFVRDIQLNETFIAPTNTRNGEYYYYFQKKASGDKENTLEGYIMKKIKPSIDKHGFYFKIFTEELLELTESTHHYKLLKIWNKKERI